MARDPAEPGAEDADPSNDASKQAQSRSLEIGSDVEIARRVRKDLELIQGELIYTEGQFWRFSVTHWQAFDPVAIRLAVHEYDGAIVEPAAGKPFQAQLSTSRINSTINELAVLCARPGFFVHSAAGINCASGFVRFDPHGQPQLLAHHPDQRQRHVLQGRWSPGSDWRSQCPVSLLATLLEGSFRGDPDAAEKIDLLGEIAGIIALGYGTRLRQPKAVVLYGPRAENGKSQVLDMLRSLVPLGAAVSIPPHRMGDSRFLVKLAGKLLNATDELGGTAVAGEDFKKVITGDPSLARDVYKSSVEFRPIAQHVLVTNLLPPFRGGMDRGVRRRLLVIPFNRTIPPDERIEGLGKRIGEEEADLLLAWAIEGARRVLARGGFYAEPPSCKQALEEWICSADPVLAWLHEPSEVLVHVDPAAPYTIRTRDAFEQFRLWAEQEGYRARSLPTINGFTQRVIGSGLGIEKHRLSEGPFFHHLRILPWRERLVDKSIVESTMAAAPVQPGPMHH